jgi:DNA polymerase III epsilon subunit-like protein
MILFLDTETTGVNPKLDRLVQIAWIAATERGEEISRSSMLVRPDGFVIPYGAARVHGITTEMAIRSGIPLKQTLQQLTTAGKGVALLVAHNLSYDLGILKGEFHRAGLVYPFSLTPGICTMKASTNYCRLPKAGGNAGFKYPKLDELYRHLFGYDFLNAHNAEADTEACMKCYFRLVDLAVLPSPAETFIDVCNVETSQESSDNSILDDGHTQNPYISETTNSSNSAQAGQFEREPSSGIDSHVVKINPSDNVQTQQSVERTLPTTEYIVAPTMLILQKLAQLELAEFHDVFLSLGTLEYQTIADVWERFQASEMLSNYYEIASAWEDFQATEMIPGKDVVAKFEIPSLEDCLDNYSNEQSKIGEALECFGRRSSIVQPVLLDALIERQMKFFQIADNLDFLDLHRLFKWTYYLLLAPISSRSIALKLLNRSRTVKEVLIAAGSLYLVGYHNKSSEIYRLYLRSITKVFDPQERFFMRNRMVIESLAIQAALLASRIEAYTKSDIEKFRANVELYVNNWANKFAKRDPEGLHTKVLTAVSEFSAELRFQYPTRYVRDLNEWLSPIFRVEWSGDNKPEAMLDAQLDLVSNTVELDIAALNGFTNMPAK